MIITIYLGLLILAVLAFNIIDVYVTYHELLTNSSGMAYSYISIYVIILGIIIYFIVDFFYTIYFSKIILDEDDKKKLNGEIEIKSSDKKRLIDFLSKTILSSNKKDQLSKRSTIENMRKNINRNSDGDIEILKKALIELDKEALEIIKEKSLRTVQISAISPKSSLDTLIFIYQAFMMVKDLIELYGYRMKSFRVVGKTILEGLATGAALDLSAEIITETIVEKVAGEILKSIGNGLMMYRIGVVTMGALSLINEEKKKEYHKEFKEEVIKDVKNKLGEITGQAKEKIIDIIKNTIGFNPKTTDSRIIKSEVQS